MITQAIARQTGHCKGRAPLRRARCTQAQLKKDAVGLLLIPSTDVRAISHSCCALRDAHKSNDSDDCSGINVMGVSVDGADG